MAEKFGIEINEDRIIRNRNRENEKIGRTDRYKKYLAEYLELQNEKLKNGLKDEFIRSRSENRKFEIEEINDELINLKTGALGWIRGRRDSNGGKHGVGKSNKWKPWKK